MNVPESLAPAELARQLGNPDGDVGLSVMRWLDKNNGPADQRAAASLGLNAGDRVLEIGFGTGRTVSAILAQSVNIRYTGIDISTTMVEEANRVHAALVTDGQVSFQPGSAEALPFPDTSFDCVFSIGVVHFWADPVKPLSEVRRVLRPGGLSLMGCLHPDSAPGFARPENGFYVRDAAEWDARYRAAGFTEVKVEVIESEQLNPDGSTIKRYVFELAARA